MANDIKQERTTHNPFRPDPRTISSYKSGSTAAMPSSVTAENGTLTTDSLKKLQSDGERKVMDIVDKLRRSGLSSVLELPQLVVCGDQSSGKSSVLEAITEIPFPRKENLCTRFATEIVLRRQPTNSVSIKITPDKLRTKEEQTKLAAFSKTIKDLSELPDVIEEATLAMGLGRVGELHSRAFSRDVLSVEICGPDRPQLTLVDLPGLIHATNKAQTATDKELILALVQEYMKNPRTIILAVVSAKNDFANQVILDYCQKIDKKGRRTLGIITKPDFLRADSENERSWIDLAQNKDIYLERGWHMLKNRADNEMHFSFKERHEAENLFFSKGRYVDLPRECVGIDTLRTRLSSLLLNHLIKELPSLKKEITEKLEAASNELAALGQKRETSVDQRMLLTRISMEINHILTAAIGGHYVHPFFGAVDMDASIGSEANIKRFRAVVQHLNYQFAENIRLRGHRFKVTSGQTSVKPTPKVGEENEDDNNKKDDDQGHYDEDEEGPHSGDDGENDEKHSYMDEGDIVSSLPKPKRMSPQEAITWVKKVMKRSRGHELPGNFNPELISHLFWDQSKPWETIAYLHVNEVARACKTFIYLVLKEVAPAEFLDPLKAITVDVALQDALTASLEELNKLLEDKTRHPMTYNHYFTTTVQKSRQHNYRTLTASAKRVCTPRAAADKASASVKPEELQNQPGSIQQNMRTLSAEEALKNLHAYYKDESKYFVAAVTKQVVERYLVDSLPQKILSPIVVAGMSDSEISYVAAEPPDIVRQRAFLEQRKVMLEKGLETFREAMGGLKR